MAVEGLDGFFTSLLAVANESDPVLVKSIRRGDFAVARISCDGICAERSVPSLPDEAFAVCLKLKHRQVEVWYDGRLAPKCPSGHDTSIHDLRSEIAVRFNHSFDLLYLYFPRQALAELADQEGVTSLDLCVAQGRAVADPTIAHLGASLLPALDDPRQANELFLESVATAIQSHFLMHYVGKPHVTGPARSGLTGRQLLIAKRAICANLGGNVPLRSIAQECGLSPSHFARAFAISVGQPPHQWLLEQRVDLARQLLGRSTLPLSEIAIQCGFADQSHFTRVFSAKTGLAPGRWRRVSGL
jgi:AraC family transcriptional regulator